MNRCKSRFNPRREGLPCNNTENIKGAHHLCALCYNRIKFRLDNGLWPTLEIYHQLVATLENHENAKRPYNTKANEHHKAFMARNPGKKR